MPEEATTPDLVRMHRAMVDAAARGDVDGAMAFFTPDAVWDATANGGNVMEGIDEIRSFVDDWLAFFQGFHVEAQDVRAFGSDVTMIVLAQRAEAPGSSRLVEESFPSVARWLHGRVTHATNYRDVAEARAAAERLARKRG